MILDEHLKSWLVFEKSTENDVLLSEDSWSGYNLSLEAGRRGNACKFSGSQLFSYGSANGFTLGGDDFTFDGWFKIKSLNSSKPGPIIALSDKSGYPSDGGKYLFDLTVDIASNSGELVFLCSNTSTASSDYTTYNTGLNVTLNQWYYYAIVYEHTAGTLTLYIDGVSKAVHTCSYTSLMRYVRYGFDYGISNTRQVSGSLDDLCIYVGKALYNGNHQPPANSYYENLTICSIDSERRLLDHAIFRYENSGRIEGLSDTTSATQLSVPSHKSKTGFAYYQTARSKTIDVPADKEIWIKFDVYYDGVTRWRCYDDSGSVNGFAVTAHSNTTDNKVSIQIWHNGSSSSTFYCPCLVGERNTYILHLFSDSSNGFIKVMTNNGANGTWTKWTGNVNNGQNFTHLNLQSDGPGSCFSNIIIANEELTFADFIPNSPIAFDVIRMVSDSNEWRYRNKGEIDSLVNTTTAVKVDNLPATKSVTGSAFYQSTAKIGIFDIEAVDELWIRFDAYAQYNGGYWWVGDYTNSTSNTANYSGPIVYINNEGYFQMGTTTAVRYFYKGISRNELNTFVLHMKAHASAGLIELFMQGEGLICSYEGAVNQGSPFSKVNMFSGTTGATYATLFSNIVISNAPLWFDDTARGEFAVEFMANTERRIESSVSLSIDTEREIVSGASVSCAVDVERTVYRTTSVSYVVDIERVLTNTVAVQFDIERDLTNTVTLNLDIERILTDEDPVIVIFDTMRMTHVPATEWRYENIGKTDTLQNTTTAVQLSNLPRTQSRTGMAFYQPYYNRGNVNLFDGTQSSDEVWIKFDVYRESNGWWNFWGGKRIYEDGYYYSDNESGVDVETTFVQAPYDELEVFYKDGNYIPLDAGTAKYNTIQTVLLHMKGASAENGGLYELYTADGGLVYSYSGEVHDGEDFETYGMYMHSSAMVSNLIISNQPIWMDDNATMSEPVSLSFDVNRQVENAVDIVNDAERILLAWTENISLSLDTNRDVVLVPTLSIDTERDLYSELSISIDLERFIIGAEYALAIDAVRQIGNGIVVLFDRERYVNNTVVVPFDTEREIIRIEDFYLDTARYLPYQLAIDGTETTVIPMAPNDAGLQSINIQMSEQQVTDRVSFVHAGNCNIMDKIQGTYRDYVFDLRIEETDRQGVIQSCNCCSDIDELLYSQIAYTIPEDKYEWSQDYLDRLGIKQREAPEEEIEAQPTTTVEEHLRMIAGKMGKSLVYRGPKFYSTNNVDENGGKTYASVISELIGWSSRLPQMEINAYFRGDKLYVIMRGFESNTVSLNNAKIANLRVNQKLVRTTWGSDVKSESVVDTFINDWQDLELEPYTPEAGGGSTSTYGDDNLVETTTTESESEKNETTYYYNVDSNGAKYLAYEETVKYEKDERGNWQEFDTITTTHERVSTTQSHIYAEDGDGGIVGEVVSPNRFDDRATPYDKGHGGGGRGYVLMHDSQGNQYKCYSIKYYSEEMEKGTRTTYGLSLVDTSFPVYGEANLTYLTQQLMWLNRKTEETVSMDIYDVDHIIGFDDKISFNGAIYHLKSNNILQNEHIINKQSIAMVRWI